MKKNWQTFGHNFNKQLLDKQISSGKLFHAYVFMGPAGIGKQTLAREFAGKLLAASSLYNHPDFHFFDAEAAESVEQVREFIGRLGKKPFLANFNFAVIDSAELLNKESSNALLKTMEEPTLRTVIVLVAQTRNLLPTILSRCVTLNFAPLSESEFTAFATSRAVKDESVIKLSLRNPGKLQWLLDGDTDSKQWKDYLDLLQKAQVGPMSEKLLAVDRLASLDQAKLKQLLSWWQERRKLFLTANPADYALLKNISESSALLNTAMNKKNILQKLLVTSN